MMKKLGVVLIIVLFAVGLLTVVGCENKQQPKADKQVDKAIDEAINKELNTSEEVKPSVEGSVGKSVKLGDIEVKVVGWKFATPDDFDKPYERPNNKLVIADVEVINNSSESYQCDGTNNMRIRTPEGYEYELWDYALPDPQFPSTAIDPGERARGFVSFEVPKDISGNVLIFLS